MPFTGQPVADLWEICLAMSRRIRERFRRNFPAHGENGADKNINFQKKILISENESIMMLRR